METKLVEKRVAVHKLEKKMQPKGGGDGGESGKRIEKRKPLCKKNDLGRDRRPLKETGEKNKGIRQRFGQVKIILNYSQHKNRQKKAGGRLCTHAGGGGQKKKGKVSQEASLVALQRKEGSLIWDFEWRANLSKNLGGKGKRTVVKRKQIADGTVDCQHK